MNIQNTWRYFQNAQQRTGTLVYTLTKQAKDIALSENMMNYEFTPTVSNPTATIARLEFRPIGNIAVNQLLTITNAQGDSVSLRSSFTPTYNQFWTEAASTSFEYRVKVAQSIVYELQNSTFGRNYSVRANSEYIVIEALSNGNEYSMTVTLPSNFQLISNTVGQDRYNAEAFIDYSLYGEVYAMTGLYGQTQDRFTGALMGSFTLPFNGEPVNVDVSGYIKDQVDIVLPAKRFNYGVGIKELDVNAVNPILRPYFVLYGDYYRFAVNGEKKRFVAGVTDVKWVQSGNFDLLDFYTMGKFVWNSNNGYMFEFMTDIKEKEVTMESHEYLQCIHRYTGVSCPFGFEVTVTFLDQTTQTVRIPVSDAGLLSGSNTSFDVSPINLGIDGMALAANKVVQEYTLRMYWTLPFGSGFMDYFSETVKYKMYYQCSVPTHNIIYFNPYGAWSSQEFRSNMSVGVTKEQGSFKRALPTNSNDGISGLSSNVNTEVRKVMNSKMVTTYTMETGMLPIEQYKALQQLIQSNAVFIWDKDERNYRPIIITENNFLVDTKTDEASLTISFQYTVDNNTLTR